MEDDDHLDAESADSGANSSDDESDTLPVPRDGDRIERLKEEMERLDGPSDMLVPIKAYDIGDVDERPNPRATDLEYLEGAEVSVANNFAGVHIMYDQGEGSESQIRCDPDTFIEDVSQMA